MKGLKKALAVVLCMLLMLTPLATVAETVTVHAAQDDRERAQHQRG